MLNRYRNNISGLLLLFLGNIAISQTCQISVEGQVLDQSTDLPLPYVNVIVQEKSKGTMTNNDGFFKIDSLCAGEYHLIFSHIGCEGEKLHIDLENDSTFYVKLEHLASSLTTIVVQGKSNSLGFHPKVSITREDIEDQGNKTISTLLENEVGVSLLKSGTISKPVVHGLFGNRLPILNNGILQSGQQWGNDHSPEIDPFSSDKISVIKGVSALEFVGGTLGNVIVAEPKPITHEPHLHGKVNYKYESNGRGHNFNLRLEKHGKIFAWRINGTLKKYGDRNTANYFLTNTGSEEANLSLQVEKKWNEKWLMELYSSTFNTSLGILRGSHISNTTDLQEAIGRQVPLYTQNAFQYSLEAPKQKVSHHLLKLKLRYFTNKSAFFEFISAGQINDRKEFDIRRGGRNEIPSLSLLNYSANFDLKYVNFFEKGLTLRLGNQNILVDNTNNPETSILPLIPDYFSISNGIYATISKQSDHLNIKLGIRGDFVNQNVAAISQTVPRQILRFDDHFLNYSALFNLQKDLSLTHNFSISTGYGTRNPAINERFSNGLHQGVSGIEEGDPNLNIEKSWKSNFEYKWTPSVHFSLTSLAYYHSIKDYIFLSPQNEVRTTIRGSFPVFEYEQTKAQIFGFDISNQFTITKSLYGLLKYSYLKGQNVSQNIPLVFMPSNNLYTSLTYRYNKVVKINKKVSLEDAEFEVNSKVVEEQKNLLTEQDFLAPPSGYHLLGMKLSSNFIFPNYKFRLTVNAENILDIQYRDYLNRQRYFADDLGRSVTFGLNFKF